MDCVDKVLLKLCLGSQTSSSFTNEKKKKSLRSLWEKVIIQITNLRISNYILHQVEPLLSRFGIREWNNYLVF